MGYELEDEELFFGDAQTTTCIEKFSVKCQKEIGITLAQDWLYFPVGLDNQRRSCNQSEGNLINLLLIWYLVFYRYSCNQRGFTLSSLWLFATCSFVLIGCCDYFGCRPTSLKVTQRTNQMMATSDNSTLLRVFIPDDVKNDQPFQFSVSPQKTFSVSPSQL